MDEDRRPHSAASARLALPPSEPFRPPSPTSARVTVKLAYEDVGAEAEDGTDAAAVAAGFACFTPLEAVCEAVDVALGGLQTRFG